ncbi:MAG: hypothetical protein R2817_09580 [Flavobacteriales bacterium]
MNTLKTLLLTLIAIALVALLVARMRTGQDTTTVVPPVEAPSPFENLPIRYDGHYREQRSEAVYLMRFFPEGRIVMINGTADVDSTLADFLVRDTKGNPAIGLYNVMPRVVGDSLFFTTRPEKGEIDYAGAFEGNELVRFKRYSHITGARQLMEYEFRADEASEQ